MKRLPMIVLALLFLATFAAVLAHAADLDTRAPENTEAPEATQATEVTESCAAGFTLEAFLTTPINELNQVDISPLDCNCNSDADCKRLCGGEGGTCFIGPVCNNWPNFTGKCMCPKPIGVQN